MIHHFFAYIARREAFVAANRFIINLFLVHI